MYNTCEYTNHFANLKPPLSPDDFEIECYKNRILANGKTLLLGYTKELIDICDVAVDLHPHSYHPKIVVGDWFNLTNITFGDSNTEGIQNYFDTIIGDGVLNLVGGGLVEALSKRCRRLVIRFFTEKVGDMRYATYFKENTEMLLPDEVFALDFQQKIVMLVWNFEK